MLVTHELKGKRAQKEVSKELPLGFFLSNKTGSALVCDVSNDNFCYHYRTQNKTLSLIKNIEFPGSTCMVRNFFHSIALSRETAEYIKYTHIVAAPFYTDGLLFQSDQQILTTFVLEAKNVKKISEESGRILITYVISKEERIYLVIQGHELKYSKRKKSKDLKLDLISSKITFAVADDPKAALLAADIIYTKENEIFGAMDGYLTSGTNISDVDSMIAYTCTAATTDNIFMTTGGPIESPENYLPVPIPYFSDVGAPYTTFAVYSLMYSELNASKTALVTEFDRQYVSTAQQFPQKNNSENLGVAVWPSLILGRYLDRLSQSKMLFDLFSSTELKIIQNKLKHIIWHVNKTKTIQKNKKHTEQLESMAVRLSLYELAYAITREKSYSSESTELTKHALELTKKLVGSGLKRVDSINETIRSIILSAYVYPNLISVSEWKDLFDKLLEKTDDKFEILQDTFLPKNSAEPIATELLSVLAMLGIVLNNVDATSYNKQINTIRDRLVDEILFKGLVGRPCSSSYSVISNNHKKLFSNSHLMNNSLIMEFLRLIN